MRGLKDKIAVITGAGAGIGYATAEYLAGEGTRVVIADIDKDALGVAEQRLDEQGYELLAIHTDVANEEAVMALMMRTKAKYGSLDFLVNNAADFTIRGINATEDDWDRILSVNIKGYAFCAKHAFPYMKESGKGSIVNVSSMSALVAQPEFMTYSATKAAELAMTRNMAIDFARYGIRVNSVSPGVILTESALKNIGLSPEKSDYHPRLGGLHLLGRCGRPEEVASAITFLLSDEASFITGTNILVDGGLTVNSHFKPLNQ
ncbi:MAG: SDR family NAD(P)-dependent oxidoreductase [Candidatus Nanoarchaeia archaeon]